MLKGCRLNFQIPRNPDFFISRFQADFILLFVLGMYYDVIFRSLECNALFGILFMYLVHFLCLEHKKRMFLYASTKDIICSLSCSV